MYNLACLRPSNNLSEVEAVKNRFTYLIGTQLDSHTLPGSIKHKLLHPSPSLLFPSSHSSAPN